jgi:hypothetical protein
MLPPPVYPRALSWASLLELSEVSLWSFGLSGRSRESSRNYGSQTGTESIAIKGALFQAVLFVLSIINLKVNCSGVVRFQSAAADVRFRDALLYLPDIGP